MNVGFITCERRAAQAAGMLLPMDVRLIQADLQDHLELSTEPLAAKDPTLTRINGFRFLDAKGTGFP